MTLTLCMALLQGCGGGSEAVDNASNISTGKNGGGEIEGTESNNPDYSINPNEIVVRVEATSGMRARSLSAGDATTNVSLSVVRMDAEGKEYTDVISPSSYSTRINTSDNTLTLTFDNGIPDRLDLVVKATFNDGSGTIMRRALPNSNQGIVINAATEHVVRRFFSPSTFPDPAELTDMLDCGTSTTDCHDSNDPRPALWQGLNDVVSDFEITLDDSLDLDQALTELDNHALFMRYEDQYFQALRSTLIKGQALNDITQALEVPPVLNNRGGTYNSVTFALESTQFRQPEATTGIGVRYSHANALDANPVTWQYPRVILSNLGVASIPTVLTEEIPVLRDVMQESDSGSRTLLLENDASEHNSQFAGNTFIFLNQTGFWEFGRRQEQTITQKDDPVPQGWLKNPYYSHLYAAHAQQTIAGTTLAHIQNYNLAFDAVKNKYSRLSLARDIYTFNWELHLRRSDDDTSTSTDDFSLSKLDRGDGTARYAALFFEQVPSATDPVATYRAGIERWDATTLGGNSLSFTRSQPTITPDVFNTVELSRDTSHAVTGPGTSRDAAGTLTASLPETLIYDSDEARNIDRPVGRIQLGNAMGAAAPDGQLMAAIDNTSTDGARRFWVAVKLPVSYTPKVFNNQVWELHGNFVQLDGTQHCMGQTNNAKLVFNASGQATLIWGDIMTCEQAASGTLSSPVLTQASSQPLAAPDNSDPQAIKMSFSDPYGQGNPLELEGFISEDTVSSTTSDADLMVLRLRHGQRLGLIFAMRQQSLTENSD
ncbi:MAG: hypothetical protein D6758_08730 [Gammaproteobacteria bacterium]|nr:MAG: hypothetical protein D6758_08730 [Gammaproteobacteria bacterium]